ncbi:pyridoxine 5'-phosphate synthase [Siccirubricoccus deserti]|uniref:Pyridoxine 5'-phosphate synthase n=1 Tax=Siccirubricoccus deserti TaxID=2013562 RepID=A0A9X0QXA7_9PROT|nr:pyridoxine 5'-phosphate synthase [Siccirubricoccus deserti]MBC4014978.1 pyridoxine 5'-phosphate synthase [Siccirubricoccus deserti]GGC36540.1 pyridoxine 5'-phosphate synthase [Siccirubricoccus deserti]
MRLSVNVDHVATLRNARGGAFPCPVEAARCAVRAGADGVTVHLREDRRHIRDRDVERISAEVATRLNFEMAATEEMVGICLRLKPPACCLVPEKRAELTTEGGLDVLRSGPALGEAVKRLAGAGIEVSIFIEADAAQIEAAARLGAQAIELHTGTYADATPAARAPQLERLKAGAAAAAAAGLACHAGHGLTYDTIGPIAAMPQVAEVSIGHFIISQSIFEGLPSVVHRFRRLITEARG